MHPCTRTMAWKTPRNNQIRLPGLHQTWWMTNLCLPGNLFEVWWFMAFLWNGCQRRNRLATKANWKYHKDSYITALCKPFFFLLKLTVHALNTDCLSLSNSIYTKRSMAWFWLLLLENKVDNNSWYRGVATIEATEAAAPLKMFRTKSRLNRLVNGFFGTPVKTLGNWHNFKLKFLQNSLVYISAVIRYHAVILQLPSFTCYLHTSVQRHQDTLIGQSHKYSTQ